MKIVRGWLQENPLIHECSKFEPEYEKLYTDWPGLEDVPAMVCSYAHGSMPSPQCDLGIFFKGDALERLKNYQAVLIFDGVWEGFSVLRNHMMKTFHDLAAKYNLPYGSVHFISGNLKDVSLYEMIILSDRPRIQVYENVLFDRFASRVFLDQPGKRRLVETNKTATLLHERKKVLNKKFVDKFYVNFNRRNRFWRTYAVYKLHTSGLSNYGLISHNSCPEDSYQEFYQKKALTYAHLSLVEGDTVTEDFMKFVKRNLKEPMIVDRSDFHTNHAHHAGESVHQKVLFSLTNETLQNHWRNTSLFYSEKTFKPMLHFMPILIWGQPGANTYLNNLGYKTYHDWFDLSFDTINDTVLRWNGLQKELNRVCKMLAKMKRHEQIDWSLQNEEVLMHNFKTAISGCDLSMNELKLMFNNIHEHMTKQTNRHIYRVTH